MKSFIKIGIITILMLLGIIMIPKEEQAVTYKKSADTISVKINGTDTNYNSNNLSKTAISAQVNGTTVSATINLSSSTTQIDNGIQYIVSISSIPTTANGNLDLTIDKGTLTDKAGNQNIANVINTGICIDNIAPTTTAPTATSATYTGSTSSITVTNNQTDSESGIKTKEYAIYKNSAWSAWQSSNTFTGLSQNTSYTVKTRATDNVGNVAESSSKTITTAAKIYTITLNNQSATTAGTTTIYEKYNTGIYLNSTCSTQMTTSVNGIAVPTKTGYTFGGYYTGTDGSGTQLISASGNITSSFSSTYFSGTATLYAKWNIIKLYVGDYINYTPDTVSAYSKSKLVSGISGSSSNTSDISQDTLNWQILRIYDDGSMDLIGTPTTQKIYFSSATGYNNGVNIMNDICKSLYSKTSNGITARSVNIEDYEYWLTDAGKTTRAGYSTYSGGPKYGHTQTYISKRYYPNLYLQEKGSNIDSGLTGLVEGIDKETGKTNGLGISAEGTASGSKKADASLTVEQTYYYISNVNETNFGEGYKALYNGTYSWVASRCAYCYSGFVDFGLRRAGTGLSGTFVFNSGNNTGNYSSRLRPVVSLGSGVQVTASSTAGTSSGTPHTITKY